MDAEIVLRKIFQELYNNFLHDSMSFFSKNTFNFCNIFQGLRDCQKIRWKQTSIADLWWIP